MMNHIRYVVSVACLAMFSIVGLALVGFLIFCAFCAYPSNYTGYQPGTVRYEAREVWYSLPEVLRGGEWTVDWTAFFPGEK